jgi:hypothetical protein
VIPFVITMAIRVITMAIPVITMAIPVITMRRSACSRCGDPRVHDAAIWVITMPRNAQ